MKKAQRLLCISILMLQIGSLFMLLLGCPKHIRMVVYMIIILGAIIQLVLALLVARKEGKTKKF
jgi:hypothetical protein